MTVRRRGRFPVVARGVPRTGLDMARFVLGNMGRWFGKPFTSSEARLKMSRGIGMAPAHPEPMRHE